MKVYNDLVKKNNLNSLTNTRKTVQSNYDYKLVNNPQLHVNNGRYLFNLRLTFFYYP